MREIFNHIAERQLDAKVGEFADLAGRLAALSEKYAAARNTVAREKIQGDRRALSLKAGRLANEIEALTNILREIDYESQTA